MTIAVEFFRHCAIDQAVNDQDVYTLCKILFQQEITPGEEEIIKVIVFKPDRRICITAHTRYGKTWAVAIAILLWAYINEGHEIDVISPQRAQSSKLMEYVAENIIVSPELRRLVDTRASSVERLKTEVSKTHITMKNGCHIRILSGYGTGDRLMGHGGQLIIIDESCLLSYEVFRTKVSRMEEDSGIGETKIVQIGNPWDKSNQFYAAWKDSKYRNIHISWEQGVMEGRISQEKIDDQRDNLSPTEFKILYDSEFPDSAEDALIPWDHIIRASNNDWSIDGNIIWGLDPADSGTDLTVLTKSYWDGIRRIAKWQRVLDCNEPMQIVKLVCPLISRADPLRVDSIGVGSGVHSRLKELEYNSIGVRVSRAPFKNIKDKLAKKRGKDIPRDRFLNQKAQHYWHLRELFEENLISIPNDEKLKQQLADMRWQITTAGKIKIIDPPDGSPDFADSLMLSVADVTPYEGVAIGQLSNQGENPNKKNKYTKQYNMRSKFSLFG